MADSQSAARKAAFPMTIQGGMLEALGINMYTSIGKCLVEFLANAYDSDASKVTVTIPFSDIETHRQAARTQAQTEVKEGKRGPFTILLSTLPDTVTITIKDDGHGMSPEEVENRFLPINRKRREEGGAETKLKSESGKRFVMGRKGLGKLAGFGAAEKVVIQTKRKGQTFATIFTLDYATLKNSPNITEVQIPAEYVDALNPDEHGTTITLTRLKCDAVKYSDSTIEKTISENFFGILPEDFTIEINGAAIAQETSVYEFIYPEDRPHNDLAKGKIVVPDVLEIEFDYAVKFHARKDDPEFPGATGHLAAAKRGARIYCNKRLAAGPSLFDLHSGMHNFHSQSYMECIVFADALDRHEIDLINTNRTQLKEDNEVVQSFVKEITEIMKRALAAHSVYRDAKAAKDLEKDAFGSQIAKVVDALPSKQRKPATSLLKIFASDYGVASTEFREVAPVVLDAMNASKVLVKLIELGTDPGSLGKVARQLEELNDIEKHDILKLYRGRRSGIRALEALATKADDEWKSGHKFENELHELLKSCPWLIKPEYSRYTTSNEGMGKVATEIAKALSIDKFAAILKDGEEDTTRPDLVFAMTDTEAPHIITVVELKSPNIPLDHDHLTQLEGYMMQIGEYVTKHYKHPVTVRGYLIGTMADATSAAHKVRLLRQAIIKAGIKSDWEVLGLREMLSRANTIHVDTIQALEAYEKENEEDDKEAKTLAAPADAVKLVSSKPKLLPSVAPAK